MQSPPGRPPFGPPGGAPPPYGQPYPQPQGYPQQPQQGYPQQPAPPQQNYGPTQVMPQAPMMQPPATQMQQPLPMGAPLASYWPQPGAPAMPVQPSAGGPRAPVRMSGAFYVTFFVICMLATGALAVLGSDPKTTEALPFIPLPLVVLGVVEMVFIYKMWNAIHDGQTKPTPGAALGFLFIPLFSIYWVFVVFCGYPSRYNAYAQRHGLRVQPLGVGLYIAALLCGWIPLVGLVLQALMLGKTCKAVNALNAAR